MIQNAICTINLPKKKDFLIYFVALLGNTGSNLPIALYFRGLHWQNANGGASLRRILTSHKILPG